ncbi:MAG: ParA family protein [Anaerolineae bacterium]|nr:MAG: ParA family protein [Anaerolineae bacterium]
MTHIFVLTNHKGGVGKSTSATNIAFGISRVLAQSNSRNCRVLLIDTDSQGHATLVTTGRNDFGRDDSLYSVITADKKDAPTTLVNCIVQSEWDENLHVLPASPLLEAAEREMIGIPGAPYRLTDPLSRILNRYAAVVIDTRPSFSLMTEMGLLCGTDALIPVEPRYLETVGLQSVIDKINAIREGWRCPNLKVSGVIVTKLDKRVRGHLDTIEKLKSHPYFGKLLCGIIPANEAVAYAHTAHLSVYQYDPNSIASAAYAMLVKRLVRLLVAQEGV